MDERFYEKVTRASQAWAKADREAAEADLLVKNLTARLWIQEKATGCSNEECKMRVEASDVWQEASLKALTARYAANLAKRELHDKEMAFEHWRTIQANERFTTRSGT